MQHVGYALRGCVVQVVMLKNDIVVGVTIGSALCIESGGIETIPIETLRDVAIKAPLATGYVLEEPVVCTSWYAVESVIYMQPRI